MYYALPRDAENVVCALSAPVRSYQLSRASHHIVVQILQIVYVAGFVARDPRSSVVWRLVVMLGTAGRRS